MYRFNRTLAPSILGVIFGMLGMGMIGVTHAATTPTLPKAYDQARLIAFGAAMGLNGALLVDRLAGLRGSDQLQSQPDAASESLLTRPAFAPTRWLDAEGRSWQALDLAALARDARFLSIVA